MNKEFIFRFFDVVDRFKAREFSEFFTENAAWTFANNPPMRGRDAIRRNAELIFSQLDGIGHQLVSFSVQDHTLFTEGRVTYLRKDGKKIELPFSSVTFFDDRQLIQEYRTYIDPSPLYETAPETVQN
jgi:ketosteroid isomerase-like protein